MLETPIAGKPSETRGAREFPRVLKLVLVLLITALVVVAVIVWGIDARIKTAAAVKRETQDLAMPTVAVAHPKMGSLENEVVLPGNIQAFIDAPVSARASGYLKKWYADIGAHVKAGQTLAEIDAPELDQQVRQAEAAVEQAKAALDQTLANLQQGKANAELARVNAQRWTNLVAKGVVSRQENDQYQAQYQAQTANVAALEKGIAAARGNVSAAEANLSRLQELQGYKTVKAPFDGVITVRNTDIGALVSAGNGAASAELFHIAATAKLRVYVNVPQIYSRAAVPGIPAELTLSEFPGRRFRGKLVRTAEAMDAGTRTLLTEVDVDNPTGELKPGAYAEVHLTIPAAAPSVIVPVGALLFRSEGLRLGLIRDGNRVELVPIILGKDFGTEVEVLSGIRTEDLIILNPADSLTSGALVRPVQADEPRK
jgi:RND family efflux transporter MFP subunit